MSTYGPTSLHEPTRIHVHTQLWSCTIIRYHKVFLMISTTHTIAVSMDLKHLIVQRVFLHCSFSPWLLSLSSLFPSFLNATVTWISSVFLLQGCTGRACPGWLEITVFHCKPGYLEKQTFDDGDYLVFWGWQMAFHCLHRWRSKQSRAALCAEGPTCAWWIRRGWGARTLLGISPHLLLT